MTYLLTVLLIFFGALWCHAYGCAAMVAIGLACAAWPGRSEDPIARAVRRRK